MEKKAGLRRRSHKLEQKNMLKRKEKLLRREVIEKGMERRGWGRRVGEGRKRRF